VTMVSCAARAPAIIDADGRTRWRGEPCRTVDLVAGTGEARSSWSRHVLLLTCVRDTGGSQRDRGAAAKPARPRRAWPS